MHNQQEAKVKINVKTPYDHFNPRSNPTLLS